MTIRLDPQQLRDLLTEATDLLDPTPPMRTDLRRERSRRRHRRIAVTIGAAGAVAAAAAAVLAVVVVPSGGSQRLRAPVLPADAASATGTPSPAASANPTPSSTVTPGERIEFGAMTVTLPAGWSVQRRASIPAGVDHWGASPEPHGAGEWMCVGPGGDQGPALFGSAGCNGVKFERGVVSGAGNTLFTAHQPDGWYTATDVQACLPKHSAYPAGKFDGVRPTGKPIRTGFAPVGDRTAIFDEWSAHCDSGFTFTPRSWYLPQSVYRILDLYNNPDTDWILQHITYH
jgi:hypothetical protein